VPVVKKGGDAADNRIIARDLGLCYFDASAIVFDVSPLFWLFRVQRTRERRWSFD
jgi:hypothetical protein